MKRDVKLCNVFFPVWMFYFLPTVLWLLILPGNFLVDSAVLFAAMAVFHLADKKEIWKRSILPVWVVGFLSDFAGAALTFGLMLFLDRTFHALNIYLIPYAQLLVLPGIALAGVLIYFLNQRFSFRKTELAVPDVHRLCLALALFTAPYTMLWPVEWLYF